VSRHAGLLELHDIDLMLRTLEEDGCRSRLRRLGYAFDSMERLTRRRERLASRIEPRWITAYERAFGRYGRGVVAVRERVCLGCFITLPTSSTPEEHDTLTLCESCGRVLYWR
jgi:predicted  nucleic acid-binding Zn-ribbon protein